MSGQQMTTGTNDDPTPPPCPYCGYTLRRPTEGAATTTTHREQLARPEDAETRARDINIGLALGLAVVLFMDIGVFVRREFTPFGFITNVLIAAAFTVLLPLWYWRMRVDTAATNAEGYVTYQRRMEAWRHTYYCAHCDAIFHRN
jgi:predicted outer membrane lipoprotein